MAISKGFNPEEFHRTLERMVVGQDGPGNPRPDFDAKLHKEVLEAQAQGRKPESFQQVLEHWGFKFYARWRTADGQLQPQWRLYDPTTGIRAAFTEQDLVVGYESPENFDRWFRQWRLSRLAALAGK